MNIFKKVSSTSSSLGESSGLLLPSSSSGMTTRSSSSSSSSVSEVTTQLSEVSFNIQCDEVTKQILDGRLITNLKKIYLVSNLTVSIQYDTYIQRIIINDNEDDNYYKKNILKTIINIIATYVYFFNYYMLLDIDYLKEYWKNEEARISKSIIAEESFYLIEQLSAKFTRTVNLNRTTVELEMQEAWI